MNTTNNKIEIIQPPKKLASGFLDFAKEVKKKSDARGAKFSAEEMAELFNESFSGKIRANFILWIGDLNRIIDGINIILTDLSDLRADRNSLKGAPIIRSELLFQSFFGEFFRLREISKIFIKLLTKEKVLNNKAKETFVGFYFQAFDDIYEIRNLFIHQGLSFNDEGIPINESFFNKLAIEEKEKFIKILEQSNTRENTVEIQCAIYVEFIIRTMKRYVEFQSVLNSELANLILSYEKKAMTITVENSDCPGTD